MHKFAATYFTVATKFCEEKEGDVDGGQKEFTLNENSHFYEYNLPMYIILKMNLINIKCELHNSTFSIALHLLFEVYWLSID